MWLRRTPGAAYLLQLADALNPLLLLEESGPGYQLIEIGLAAERAAGDPEEVLVPAGTYIAFNAELLVPVVLDWDPRAALHGWDGALDYDSYKSALKPSLATGLAGKASIMAGSGTAGAPRSTFVVTSTTSPSQVLWRISAFNPDKRIVAGRALAGAYLTSDRDHAWVNTGLGAVGRYALPNPFPATHWYRVTPTTGSPFRAGTVRPAFGQAGGGVEVVLGVAAPALSLAPPLPDL